MSALCRDCAIKLEEPLAERCPACRSHRLLAHPELHALCIAHIDCDAFYASVEKRDNPELTDRPVIIGGGHRGVVAAACYVSRLYGVRSAMPMFKALKLCPDAVVIRPNMAKYQSVGRAIRSLMLSITPLVEPLSIDEAFLDLSGTERLHDGWPAQTLARLAKRIEEEHGVTASIGLSYNKFLAKIASDLDKPRGFAVIGRAEAKDFLGDKPVGLIWGVGKALGARLERQGITRIRHLRAYEEADLVRRFGTIGKRLHRFARGEDERPVDPNAPTKSISAETTFDRDIASAEGLLAELWPLCEKVARRCKRSELGGHTVTLKLKTADFRTLTRSRRLADATLLADMLYEAARPLVAEAADGRPFRLIGIGLSDLVSAELADPPNLFDAAHARRARIEQAVDSVRARLGEDAIRRGRGLGNQGPEKS